MKDTKGTTRSGKSINRQYNGQMKNNKQTSNSTTQQKSKERNSCTTICQNIPLWTFLLNNLPFIVLSKCLFVLFIFYFPCYTITRSIYPIGLMHNRIFSTNLDLASICDIFVLHYFSLLFSHSFVCFSVCFWPIPNPNITDILKYKYVCVIRRHDTLWVVLRCRS